MSKTFRRLLIGAGVLVGALVVLVIGVGLFFDVNHYKPEIEGAVAKATGMNLKIDGKISLKMIPYVRVSLDEVHLSNAGSELFDVKTLEVTPRLFPFLLHREVVIGKVSLISPKVLIEKSASGRMNFETAKKSNAPAPSHASAQASGSAGAPAEVHSIGISNGSVAYLDHSTGQNIQITGLNIDLSGISLNTNAADKMKSLRFHGNVDAQSLKLQTKSGVTTASNLKIKVRDDDGLIRLDPTQVGIFGGKAQGNAQIDLRSAVPKIELSQNASGIDIDQAAPQLKSKLSGSVDAVVKITASGKDADAITKTMNGTVSVRSKNIATSVDVDGLAGKLKSAQGMDLVGLGSSFLSSKVGKATTQAAGVAGGAEQPKNLIRDLVSDWNINNGIAQTKDVAFATAKTTVAFKGDLNLVDKKYQNFYVATVDPKGCSKNKVEVGGSLDSPRPVAGSVGKQLSESYLGSAGSALGSEGSQIAGLFGGKKEEPKAGANPPTKESTTKKCDQFYSGSAIHTG
jgi:hypothetical protein